MSFETISIFRDFPIINGYVHVPSSTGTRLLPTLAEVLISGSTTVGLSSGSNARRGGKNGRQEFLRLPAITPNTWYAIDPSDV